FEDPEGQRLRLPDDGGAGEAHSWARRRVPAVKQIRRVGRVPRGVPEVAPPQITLENGGRKRQTGGYASPAGEGHVHGLTMDAGAPAAELHVAVQPNLPTAWQGAGAVHHVAFRTPDQESMQEWVERLRSVRMPSSGEVERYYFRSLYFREPNG